MRLFSRTATSRSLVGFAALAASSAAVEVASADPQPSANLRSTYAPLGHEAGVMVDTVASPSSGDVTGVARLTYALRPVTLRDERGNLAYSVIDHQVTTDLAMSVGIEERVTLGLDLPVLLGQSGDDVGRDEIAARYVGQSPIPVSSLGDPGLRARVTIVKPGASFPGVPEGFGLALDERFTLPLGDERSFVGEGAVTSETRLAAEVGLGAVSGHLAAGVKLRADEGSYACDPDRPIEACTSRFGHELPMVLGFALHPQALGVDPEGNATIFVEAFGHMPLAPVAPTESVQPWALEGSVGGRYRMGDVALIGALRTSLVNGVGSSPFSLMIGVSFAPKERDTDGDGIADDHDTCPKWAEDRDGREDTDGCPEMDHDGDGVPDPLDQCPDRKGTSETRGC